MSQFLPIPGPGRSDRSVGIPWGRNILDELPPEYALSLCTNTDSTTSSIVGPGRLLGSLLSFAGRRVEKIIDRFVERRLGRGPNVAALRIASELDEMHILSRHAADRARAPQSSRAAIRSELSRSLMNAFEAAHTLVRICNGLCPQCQRPYVPHMWSSIEVSLTFRRSLQRLLSYLSNNELSNVEIAATHVQIIVESRVVSPSMFQELRMQDLIEKSMDYVYRKHLISAPETSRRCLVMLRDSVSCLSYLLCTLLLGDADITDAPNSDGCHSADPFLSEELVVDLQQLYSCPDVPAFMKEPLMSAFKYAFPKLMQVSPITVDISTVLAGHQGQISSVTFSGDGTQIASGSDDWTIRIWSTATRECDMIFRSHTAAVGCVRFSPDNSHICSASDDRTVQTRLVDPGADMPSVYVLSSWATCVVYSHDGSKIASGSTDGRILIRELEGDKERIVRGDGMEWVRCLVFTLDGRYILSGSIDEGVRKWNVRTGELVAYLDHDSYPNSLALSPDGWTLYTGAQNGTVQLWDLKDDSLIDLWDCHSESVRSVSVSPGGMYVASGSADKTIRIWKITVPDWPVATLRGHQGPVNSVSFSPCGHYIVSGSGDRNIRIWDLSTFLNSPLLRAATIL